MSFSYGLGRKRVYQVWFGFSSFKTGWGPCLNVLLRGGQAFPVQPHVERESSQRLGSIVPAGAAMFDGAAGASFSRNTRSVVHHTVCRLLWAGRHRPCHVRCGRDQAGTDGLHPACRSGGRTRSKDRSDELRSNLLESREENGTKLNEHHIFKKNSHNENVWWHIGKQRANDFLSFLALARCSSRASSLLREDLLKSIGPRWRLTFVVSGERVIKPLLSRPCGQSKKMD